jgi:hypothetical protein
VNTKTPLFISAMIFSLTTGCTVDNKDPGEATDTGAFDHGGEDAGQDGAGGEDIGGQDDGGSGEDNSGEDNSGEDNSGEDVGGEDVGGEDSDDGSADDEPADNEPVDDEPADEPEEEVTTFELDLESGYEAYGSGYRAPSFDVAGDLVMVSGLVELSSGQASDWSTGDVIATLPAEYAPEERLIFTLNQHNKSARVDVQASGDIVYIEGDSDYAWLSLTGITYSIDLGDVLELTDDYVDYETGYRGASVTTEGDLVVISGLIETASGAADWAAGDVIATLPAELAPEDELIFTLNQHDKSARVNILPSGDIVYGEGDSDYAWLSLSGISYSLDLGDDLELTDDFADYGGAYRPPSVTTDGDLVMISGLVKTASGSSEDWNTGDVIATLPAELAPEGELIFTMNQHNKSARVNILPSGDIVFGEGDPDYGWLSLSGMTFSLR